MNIEEMRRLQKALLEYSYARPSWNFGQDDESESGIANWLQQSITYGIPEDFEDGEDSYPKYRRQRCDTQIEYSPVTWDDEFEFYYSQTGGVQRIPKRQKESELQAGDVSELDAFLGGFACANE